jgi:hypothetical protein
VLSRFTTAAPRSCRKLAVPAAVATSPLVLGGDDDLRDSENVSSGPLEESEAARDFWTPERMAKAKAARPPVPEQSRESGPEPPPSGKPVEIPGHAPEDARDTD